MKGFDIDTISTLQWIDHVDDLPVLQSLLHFADQKTIKKGAYLSRQGQASDAFYYLSKGQVKVQLVTAEGKEKTLWYTLAGNILNDVSFFHHHPTNASIIANEDCEVYEFNRVTFQEIIKKHPELAEEMLTSMSKRIRVLVHQLETSAYLKPITNVCRLLYPFSEKYGKKLGNETHIHLELTHTEIASMTSLHRVTVTKVLSQLEKEGVLDCSNRFDICIKAPEKLRIYAAYE
ncbi:Crp/Fnr family transcriptional regulator [Acidaminobacter sp. JC074]|uniref:Crp/Fnr family transcriptional regulator n=1 Tax=Acidaminobacter sp. JC074 TaxID=2530199 RepID=UPI001F0F560E|nr:Crp/Fnr family transcriptional regulator [Acidaminobacter sp. JC074]